MAVFHYLFGKIREVSNKRPWGGARYPQLLEQRKWGGAIPNSVKKNHGREILSWLVEFPVCTKSAARKATFKYMILRTSAVACEVTVMQTKALWNEDLPVLFVHGGCRQPLENSTLRAQSNLSFKLAGPL